jgi:hypothetical protein
MRKIISCTKRLLLILTFLALIATNILTLTSTAFNAALSGLVGTALGIRTVSSMMQSKLTSKDKIIKTHKATAIKRKAATRKFGTRLASRTKRVAAKSIAAQWPGKLACARNRRNQISSTCANVSSNCGKTDR